LKASDKHTAAQWAAEQRPALQSIGSPRDLGLLHRLDTGTSGLLVFAKTSEEWERLRELWTSVAVQKTYRAIVSSSVSSALVEMPEEMPWILTDPIAHSAKSAKRMVVCKKDRRTPKSAIRGKPQETFTCIHKLTPIEDGLFDAEIEIRTGVRHQIRAHLSAYGFPVLGDDIYKGKDSERLWLHSWRITLPIIGDAPVTFEAPLPTGWPAVK
jgi:23S rRNA pseudouridine1911/1915/1917 synthase